MQGFLVKTSPKEIQQAPSLTTYAPILGSHLTERAGPLVCVRCIQHTILVVRSVEKVRGVRFACMSWPPHRLLWGCLRLSHVHSVVGIALWSFWDSVWLGKEVWIW